MWLRQLGIAPAMHRSLTVLTTVLGLALAVLAPSAWADFTWDYTWRFDQTGNSCSSSGCSWGNTRAPNSATAGAPTLNWAQGWSDTAGANASDATGPLQTGYLAAWGPGYGLGVMNRDLTSFTPKNGGTSGGGDAVEADSPEHSMDNNERRDAILFKFADKVTLTGVEIGWSKTDSDIFVFAYNGATPLVEDTTMYSDLMNVKSGWKLVGSYADLKDDTPTKINAAGVSANYWLIGAYNSAFASGGCTVVSTRYDGVCDNHGTTGGDDYVKLIALYSSKPSNGVPEPHALLLLGFALTGLWATRRRARA
jgi:hypothetical protein